MTVYLPFRLFSAENLKVWIQQKRSGTDTVSGILLTISGMLHVKEGEKEGWQQGGRSGCRTPLPPTSSPGKEDSAAEEKEDPGLPFLPEPGHISIDEFVSNNSCHHWIYLSQSCLEQLSLYNSVTKDRKTMWLNKGVQCAVETGFNYSSRLNFKSREELQKNLQDLCTITTPLSGSICENSSSFSAALLGTVSIFLTCGVLLSFFFLIFTIHFRNNRIVKMSSPNLNVVTLLGSGLTYGSTCLLAIEKQTSITKHSMEMLFQARLCLLCIGSSLAFGPILGKSWRLYKVFTQQVPERRVIIKDFQLLVMVSVLVLVDVILLLIWILLDPVQCLQGINVELQVTEKGLACTMHQGHFCTSLYSDFWLLLFLGFKCSLLIYGAYLAGLTNDLSCPPVNQSLTLIIAIALIFLSTGLLLVVHRFFHLWHNLVFGFTSGGILVCTSTINCLIFIPQIRQWKAFEKHKDDASHMAKYFTSSSKIFQSTMYSDEEIYQLLGEKKSMIQQLAEKNTAIACLQEEVNNAKEKLMRLVAVEDDSVVDSPFPSLPQLLKAHSATNCSSMGAENQLRDTFLPGQELKAWQFPWLSNSQCGPGFCTKKDCTDYHKPTPQQVPLDITARCRLMNDYKKTGDDFSPKDDEDQRLCHCTNTFCIDAIQESSRLSTPTEEAKQGRSAPALLNQLPEITHGRSKNLQGTLQDLSMNYITGTQMSSRVSNESVECDMNIKCQPHDIQADIMKLSPYETRQGEKCPIPLKSLHTVDKTTSRMQTGDIGSSHAVVSDNKDGIPLKMGYPQVYLHHLPSLSASVGKKTLQDNAKTLLYLGSIRNLHQYHQKDFLMHTLQGPGSDASSSSSGADPLDFHHRHCCEFCHCKLSSSSDSYITDTDLELGMAQGSFVKCSDKSQPIVNFNEDLEPTYV
ncbi:LOW QUALITY PROTEIN: probable G-protein coupled receptor 156 [Sceloporus undulatus]|uniref:LOW QUALITY PROTEIN: probable G-protein coupled receptor 156 n=1 Tax=Sceloporus undulatus TaxID=8520 RepID=UPI001C4C4CE0|nr:LOW QUALITY PROTEIN: probable G-protein coupled receptor 156 [Sceloporus undulatus]